MANISKLNVQGTAYNLRDAASMHYIGHTTTKIVPTGETSPTGADITIGGATVKAVANDYVTSGESNLNYIFNGTSWDALSEVVAEADVQDVTVAGVSVLDTSDHTAKIVVATASDAATPKFGVVQTGANITNTNGVISVKDASDTVKGVVQLSTAIPATGAVDTKAATEKAVADAIGDATITVSGTGVTTQTFTTNQSADATITVDVPIKEIKVNDTALVPDASQSVNIEIPTDSMTFKGTVGDTEAPTSATEADVPVNGSAKVGDAYKVVTDGNYANNTIAAKVGDLLVCLTKTSGANTWVLIPSGDDVDVTSVAASTGLTTASGSAITTKGTIKLDLTSETALADTATAPTTTADSGRVFAVALDAAGHPAVNIVPGALADVVDGASTTSAVTGISNTSTAGASSVMGGHVGSTAAGEDADTLYLDAIYFTSDSTVVNYTAPTP